MKISHFIGACLFAVLSISANATILYPTSDAIRDNDADGIGDELAWFASDYVYHDDFSQSRVFNEFDVSWLPLVDIEVNSASLQFTVQHYEHFSQLSDLSSFLQLGYYWGDDSITLEDWSAPTSLLVDTIEFTEYEGPNGYALFEFNFDISATLIDFIANNGSVFGVVALDPVMHSVFDPPGLLRVYDMQIVLNQDPPVNAVNTPANIAIWLLALTAFAGFSRTRLRK